MPAKPGMRLVIQAAVAVIVIAGLVAALGAYCMYMPGASWSGSVPPLDDGQAALRDRLKKHVYVLAGDIGERHHRTLPALERAAGYIEEQFREMGYIPASQDYGKSGFRNIYVDLYGSDLRDRIIVVGAHYDTTWVTPGADDNASGVAGMLEMARHLRGWQGRRSIRFIAFANEEEPFFGGDEMGSMVAARRSSDRDENIVGMFSLEMLGYYSNAPRSQYYPKIIRRFYPREGNFIGFVADLESRDLLHRAIGAFRERAQFPSEGLSAPAWLVPDIRRSDNFAYWSYNYPAVMVTDTSNYRNFNYHNAGDMPNTLDYDAMAHVVTGLTQMVQDLAGHQ